MVQYSPQHCNIALVPLVVLLLWCMQYEWSVVSARVETWNFIYKTSRPKFSIGHIELAKNSTTPSAWVCPRSHSWTDSKSASLIGDHDSRQSLTDRRRRSRIAASCSSRWTRLSVRLSPWQQNGYLEVPLQNSSRLSPPATAKSTSCFFQSSAKWNMYRFTRMWCD